MYFIWQVYAVGSQNLGMPTNAEGEAVSIATTI